MLTDPVARDGDLSTAARRFCANHVAPHADRWDAEQSMPHTIPSELAAQGWLVPTMPAALGGAGLDNAAHTELAEAIGGACQSVRNLIAVQGMVAHALLRWGEKPTGEAWAKRIAQGRCLAAFALTEPQGGSDASRLETRVERDGDGLFLNGQKSWISFADWADVLLVIARSGENETCAILVDADADGIEVVPERGLLGLRASHVGHLRFRSCRVSEDRVIARGPFVFHTLVAGALNYGRLSTASGAVGLSQACLDLVRVFVRRRDRGDDNTLDRHPVVRGRLADMTVLTEASRLMVRRAADLQDAGSPKAVHATLSAKYFATDQAARVASDAVQLHGAIGIGEGSIVQRYFRDSKVNEIIEGANDVIRDQIALLQ